MRILFKRLIFIIVLFTFSNLYSQETKKVWDRPNWSISYKLGIADGATNDYFNNIHFVELKKSFNISKPISLNILGGYAHSSGLKGSNLNIVSLGGGISLYPIYLVSLIFNEPYDVKNDNIYMDFGLQALLNKNDFDLIYSLEANLYRFKFKNNQSLSPKLAYNIIISDKEINPNPIYKDLKYNILGFYSIGIAYNF